MLASVSSDAEDQDKILNQETRQFEKLRESIVDGKIVSGQTMQKVLDIAGEPVLVMNDGDELKWVYKPGNTGWFSTSKIYFWFDPEQGLVRWECLKVDCARK
ncbi:MAG: hypothetical protein A2Z83_00725 [Omnitrophica bacterium GWA2_52_8]|nr:MAG: hypothetical protein A2Z83_00725 [Omnitrophica bacterium GWA2_52_8]